MLRESGVGSRGCGKGVDVALGCKISRACRGQCRDSTLHLWKAGRVAEVRGMIYMAYSMLIIAATDAGQGGQCNRMASPGRQGAGMERVWGGWPATGTSPHPVHCAGICTVLAEHQFGTFSPRRLARYANAEAVSYLIRILSYLTHSVNAIFMITYGVTRRGVTHGMIAIRMMRHFCLRALSSAWRHPVRIAFLVRFGIPTAASLGGTGTPLSPPCVCWLDAVRE